MMPQIFQWLFALTLSMGTIAPLIAQMNYTQTLKGAVLDQDLKYPLIGATIQVLKDTQLVAGGRTDEEGRFRIAQIPVGRYTLTCSYLGYQDRILQNIEINSGKETQIQIEMQPAPRQYNK
ncbi:MAG: carboxypeptidase regulatory-like domain-containing protein [Bacteroidetes bacterium]|nr:carboxypeptidase regulatory-like domain-containing protein [Bacteroidota bacterium]